MYSEEVKKDIVIFDVETTGFESEDDITQIGIIVIDNETLEIKETYSRHIQTDKTISPKVISVTGVNNLKLTYLSGDKKFEDVVHEFLHFFTGDYNYVGHNIQFDMKMMRYSLTRVGVEFNNKTSYCTMNALTEEMNIRGKGNKPKFPRLGEAYNYCSRRLNQTPQYFDQSFEAMFGKGHAHDALYDSYITYVCYAYLKATRGELLYE